jgi:predicted transcriptional regulator
MAEAQIKITADTSQAQQSLKNLDASLESLGKSTATAAKFFAGLTAASAAVGYAIKQTLDSAGELVDASNRLGVSAANLNQLSQAARLAGIDTGTLNVTIQRLNRSIGEGIQKSTAPAAVALKNLGLPISEIAKLKPDEQFTKIAESLSKIENPAQRTAMSMELLGKQGPAVLQLANELEKVREITALGFGVSEGELVALDEAGDAIEQLGILFDAGIKKAVAVLAPYIVGFVANLKDAIREAGGWEAVFNRIKEIAHTIANVIAIMATIITTRLVIATAAVALNMARAAIAARSFSLFLSRTPIGLLTAGVALLADKIGIDLVGGSKAANEELSTYEKGLAIINKAEVERKQTLDATTQTLATLNDEQEKGLLAIEKGLADQRNLNKSLEDRLNLTDGEAKANKTVQDVIEKINALQIRASDEVRKRIDGIVNETRQEANKTLELEKQLRLRDSIRAALKLGEADAGAGLNTLLKYNRYLSEAIDLRKQERDISAAIGSLIAPDDLAENAENMAKGMYQTLPIIQKQINELLNITPLSDAGNLSQQDLETYRKFYNQLRVANEENAYQMSVDRLLINERAAVDRNNRELERFRSLHEVELAQYLDINQQKALIDEEYAQKKIQLDQRLLQSTINRIQREMMAQKDLQNFALSQTDKETIQRVGDMERQKAAVDSRIGFEKKLEAEKYQFVIQQGANAFNALGAHNKKAFEAAKAFNIASAIMNTYLGASQALKMYPPPFSYVAVAAQIALGLAQVAQIRSQTYSGRALGGPMVGGQSYLVGERGPEIFTPGNAGSMTPNNQIAGGATNITFNIVANDTKGFDQLLVERRPLITKIIADAQLERGRRQI